MAGRIFNENTYNSFKSLSLRISQRYPGMEKNLGNFLMDFRKKHTYRWKKFMRELEAAERALTGGGQRHGNRTEEKTIKRAKTMNARKKTIPVKSEPASRRSRRHLKAPEATIDLTEDDQLPVVDENNEAVNMHQEAQFEFGLPTGSRVPPLGTKSNEESGKPTKKRQRGIFRKIS